MPEYAAMCLENASKCEKALINPIFERHLLLKAARMYRKADDDKLCLRSHQKVYTPNALACYHTVITQMKDDSPLKAAVIREMKEINPSYDVTSNFISPAHRAFDLDLAANHCIETDNFDGALEKLTEIYDDIIERKVEDLYDDILKKHEVTMILLIILLELPSARQAPSNVKLYQYFANGGKQSESTDDELDEPKQRHSREMLESMKSLIEANNLLQYSIIYENEIPSIARIPGLTHHQMFLLDKLRDKYYKLL